MGKYLNGPTLADFYQTLNNELKRQDCKRTLIVSINKWFLKIGETALKGFPMELLSPENDPVVIKVAQAAKSKLQLKTPLFESTWKKRLGKETFDRNWKQRSTLVFKGSHLTLRSITAHDLTEPSFRAFMDSVEKRLQLTSGEVSKSRQIK